MCDPLSIMVATLGVTVASTAASFVQAEQQADAQTQMHNNNQKAALENYQQQTYDAGARQLQENEAAGMEMVDRQMQGLRQASSAQAQIGETGLGGFSMSALMNQVMNETSQNVVRTGVNRDWSAAQIGREKEGIRSTSVGQMNSTTPGVRPSALAAGLQIASSGLKAYSDYTDSTKTPKDNKTPKK